MVVKNNAKLWGFQKKADYMIGKLGFSLYVSNSKSGSSFGSASSLMVLLMWIYYSASMLYLESNLQKHMLLGLEMKLLRRISSYH